MTKIFNQTLFWFMFVQILSRIAQIIVTCAFSVQVCVMRCTVQREGCENFILSFLGLSILNVSVLKAIALTTG